MLVLKYPYQQLSRKSIDGRRMYLCPDGSKLPSVTTIIGATKSERDKQSLNNWKKRVGHANAAEITRTAANRGTKMHSYLESFMKTSEVGQPGTNPFSIQSHNMASHVIQNGLKDVSEFYGTEVNLYYPELYAGTTDTVFLENGELVIGDFKQTNKPKKTEWIGDYFLQLASYMICHDELYGTKINKGKIMMCSPELVYQEWILEGDALRKYKDMWWNRLYQYYEQKQNG